MNRQSRFFTLVAAILSVLLAGPALVGAASIAYSLIAQSWYRSTFLAYGVKLLLLYILFFFGVMAAAALAARDPPPSTRTRRLLLGSGVLAGILAAGLLESTFWSDIGEHMVHGLVFLPFLAWALVAWSRRHAA